MQGPRTVLQVTPARFPRPGKRCHRGRGGRASGYCYGATESWALKYHDGKWHNMVEWVLEGIARKGQGLPVKWSVVRRNKKQCPDEAHGQGRGCGTGTAMVCILNSTLQIAAAMDQAISNRCLRRLWSNYYAWLMIRAVDSICFLISTEPESGPDIPPQRE